MANFFQRMGKALFTERVPVPVNQATPANRITQSVTSRFSGRQNQVDPVAATALAATYTSAVKNRAEYEREYASLANNYLADCLLSAICEDALTPDVSNGEILRVNSDNEKYREVLDKFQKDFNLDEIVNGFIYDLLAHGEYALHLKVEEGKGVTEILDNVAIGSVIGFYKQGFPYKFLIRYQDGNDTKIGLRNPSDYAHFILSQKKLKVKTFDGLSPAQVEKLDPEIRELPSYIRVGRPILMGVIEKLKELQLIEKIIPASKLADISAGSMIAVEVPPSTDPKEAFTITREYEDLFNKKMTITDTGQMSLSDVLTTAGKVKVVPTFGGKGSLQQMDVKTSQSVNDLMASIRDIRDVICTSIGFPTELLFGGGSKTEVIKKYSRYLRKIKSIQQCVAKGVLQIVMAHLKNIDATSDVSVQDLEVEFLNETVNIDELEKLEYHDAVTGYLTNTLNFIGLAEQYGYGDAIDHEMVVKWMAEKVAFMNYEANPYDLATTNPTPRVQKQPNVDTTQQTNLNQPQQRGQGTMQASNAVPNEDIPTTGSNSAQLRNGRGKRLGLINED